MVDAPIDDIWSVLANLEGDFGRIQPDMRHIRVLSREGDQIEAAVRSRFGIRTRFHGVTRPGWCWLQSRFLIVAMAAATEPAGRTRVGLTGGIRLPNRATIVPFGVRRAARRSLDRLERILTSGS